MTVVLMSTEEKWLANLYGKEYDEYNTMNIIRQKGIDDNE